MKIALIGYGKMGRSIEAAAIERNHEIVLRADVDVNVCDLPELLRGADVAIEFSVPSAAPTNILACFDANVPVVTGTTGWKDQFENIKSKCEEKNASLFYASNFSIGMNLMFALNKYMAKMTGNQNQYKISLEEIHHTQKLDAPSGTAITLADDIIKNHPAYQTWKLDVALPGVLPVTAIREGDVVGEHRVFYTSSVDQIEISHRAFSREGFVLGAIQAAEWLPGKKGIFTMNDMLNL